jgi:YtkA-like
MNRLAIVAAAALAVGLSAPATSLAGGWATVGLSSAPDGIEAGEAWVVDLTVLQHGRTPLEGVHPVVRIGRPDRGTERSFRAEPTGEPGVYRARVVIPATGDWAYSVHDGFTQVHELGSVRVGDGNSADSGAGGGIGWPGAFGIAAAAGILAALGNALLRRRPEPRATGDERVAGRAL